MNTTQLFAELLIIGLGVVLWLVFLAASIFGLSLQSIAANTNLFTLAPIVGVAYVLGVVIDRIAYSLFRGLEERVKNRIFKQDSSSGVEDCERYVITSSKDLGIQVAYNRSRLRICRSWTINFSLIVISSAIWGYAFKLKAPIFLPILSLFLAATTFFVWFKLAEDHYINIRESFYFLTKKKEVKNDS